VTPSRFSLDYLGPQGGSSREPGASEARLRRVTPRSSTTGATRRHRGLRWLAPSKPEQHPEVPKILDILCKGIGPESREPTPCRHIHGVPPTSPEKDGDREKPYECRNPQGSPDVEGGQVRVDGTKTCAA